VRIEIVPYDAGWPGRFAREAARLARGLGQEAVRIDHIGSTSVPGLGAKDIVDIQVSVRSFEPEAAYREPLERLGYVHRPDAEPSHRFFYLADGTGRRLVNLHVCEVGSYWERRHLEFRDRLRRDPGLRREYEALKRRLAPLYSDTNDYSEAKSDFIEALQVQESSPADG
jgi:GrpB-like predicted nucleotidyltransferase (UPF0157 family)